MNSIFSKSNIASYIPHWVVITKISLIFTTILVAVYIFTFTFLKGQTQTQAAQPKVNVTLSPKTMTAPLGQNQIISLFISPAISGTKISGLTLAFKTSGALQINSIDSVTMYPTGDNTLLEKVKQTVAATQASTTYIAKQADALLPSTLLVKLTVSGSTLGIGNFSLDTSNSQIVGNISGASYDFGTVDSGIYTFVNPTPTPTIIPTTTPIPPTLTPTLTPVPPTPTRTPTPTPTLTPIPTQIPAPIFTPTPIPTKIPTPTPTFTPTLTVIPTQTPTPIPPTLTFTPAPSCAKKSMGDANCDGKISLIDFNIWLNEYISGNSVTADFSGDGRVSLRDFEIWRDNYLIQ